MSEMDLIIEHEASKLALRIEISVTRWILIGWWFFNTLHAT